MTAPACRLIFDNLHHRLNNPGGWPVREALAACLATWPSGVRPKIHFSTPRTEWLIEEGAGGEEPKVRQTRWMYHADYVNPFEFIDFMRMAAGLPAFDVMLEVRAKDLALTQLRDDLRRFAPDLAERLGDSTLPVELSHNEQEFNHKDTKTRRYTKKSKTFVCLVTSCLCGLGAVRCGKTLRRSLTRPRFWWSC